MINTIVGKMVKVDHEWWINFDNGILVGTNLDFPKILLDPNLTFLIDL